MMEVIVVDSGRNSHKKTPKGVITNGKEAQQKINFATL
jgi:hypothetical protein